jgi:hypothetical protein
MRRPFAFLFLLAACASLSGCCAFVPCHPATSLVGTVRDVDGQPIAHAAVTLYGTTSTTDPNGCFNIHLADALPFTLSVTAKGYKAAEIGAQAGFYRVSAKLALSQSQAQSQIEWVSISSSEYRSSTPCEH